MYRSFLLIVVALYLSCVSGLHPLTKCEIDTADVPFLKYPFQSISDVDLPLISIPLRWHFDCSFPEEEKDAVREAFVYWQSLSKKELFVEMSGCADGILKIVDSDSIKSLGTAVEALADSGVNQTFGGALLPSDITVYAPWKMLTDIGKQNVIRHEIGHVMSFEHNNDPNCLMYPDFQLYRYDELVDLCPKELEKFLCHYQ